jgi:hypothetical protein
MKKYFYQYSALNTQNNLHSWYSGVNTFISIHAPIPKKKDNSITVTRGVTDPFFMAILWKSTTQDTMTDESQATQALSFYYSFMDPKVKERALNRFAEFLEVIELTPETIDY